LRPDEVEAAQPTRQASGRPKQAPRSMAV